MSFRVVATGRHPPAGAPPCDLLDPVSVAACIAATKPHLVVNAAGSASVGRSWEHPDESFALNAAGVLNLLEALAREAPEAHLVCLSSADVYGDRPTAQLPLREDLAPLPITPYGAGKAAMEVLCGQYARGRGLRIAVVRAFNLIGPGQDPRFAVSGFARRLAAAEASGAASIELALGNPGAVRDFVDVRDGACALLEISRRQLSGTFNLCSGRGESMQGLVDRLAGLADVETTVCHDAGMLRPADPAALIGDPDALREATGFSAATPLSQSLADLIEWWRTREP